MRGAAKPDKRRQNDLNQQISIDRIPANQLSPADWQEWRQLNDVLGGHPGLDSDFVSGIVSIFSSSAVPGAMSSGGITCSTASRTSDSVRSTIG